MNQTQPGPNESSQPSVSKGTIVEKLEAKEAELDRFAAQCALPAHCPIEVENEAKRLLALTPDALGRMNAVACGEAAFVLTQFAFFLQKAVNKEQSRIRIAEKSRDKVALPYVDQVAGYGFEEKLKKAIRMNEVAEKFDKILLDAQARKDRISFLAGNVTECTHSLMALQTTKRGRTNE